jgi:hypothetical protein
MSHFIFISNFCLAVFTSYTHVVACFQVIEQLYTLGKSSLLEWVARLGALEGALNLNTLTIRKQVLDQILISHFVLFLT